MTDAPWKRLERTAAKYFGTTRRPRGGDFSVSDMDILVDVGEWLNRKAADDYIIVECKYGKYLTIVDYYTKISKISKIGKNIVTFGQYSLCDLEDFKDVYLDIILGELDHIDILEKYSIVRTDKNEPKYLHEYLQQARDYSDLAGRKIHCLPILCLGKSGRHSRVVCFSSSDVHNFRSDRKDIKESII